VQPTGENIKFLMSKDYHPDSLLILEIL